MGTKLPRKLEQKMALMGEQIKLARLRRNLSIAQVAERATCSPLTVNRIEKGSPTVSIGIYARVLYAVLPNIWGGMQAPDVKNSLLHLAYNFNDASGHMWFVYLFIGLYLFLPIISPWLEKVNKKIELCFLLLWVISSFFPYIRTAVEYVYGECYWNEYKILFL